MGVPHLSWIEHWLEPIMPAHEAAVAHVEGGMEWVLISQRGRCRRSESLAPLASIKI